MGNFPIVGARSSRDTVAMTYARSQVAPPVNTDVFTPCPDAFAGHSCVAQIGFQERTLIIGGNGSRIGFGFLVDSFAVSIYLYAVAQAIEPGRFRAAKKRRRNAVKRVSNHTHIVLSVDPEAVLGWTNEEVADRWLRVFQGVMPPASSGDQKQRIRMSLLSTPDRVKEVRKRLGSLSWLLRSLNEPIARMASQENNCSGRFWEGRFKRQALLEP